MEYKTEVIEYSPNAETLAKRIEEKANEMAVSGYMFVTMSCTAVAKAILVFKKYSVSKVDKKMRFKMRLHAVCPICGHKLLKGDNGTNAEVLCLNANQEFRKKV